jgi:hypothetical protein
LKAQDKFYDPPDKQQGCDMLSAIGMALNTAAVNQGSMKILRSQGYTLSMNRGCTAIEVTSENPRDWLSNQSAGMLVML